MTLLIFKIIYYIGLAVFCIISLLVLRHMNRFSYLGKAIRPLMVLYVLVSLIIIIFIQIQMANVEWDQPLFGSLSFSSLPFFKTSSFFLGEVIDFVKHFLPFKS